MLGTESGSSVFDFSGELQGVVDRYQAENPEAGFREIQEKFLRPHEGRIRLNQISPRCFEAAALRTTMLLFEGHYSGILQPWRHYIPLKKDFSNIGEVVDILRNDEELQKIASRAFTEIALNSEHSYENFVAGFDEVIAQEMGETELPYAIRPYSKSLYRFHLAMSFSHLLHKIRSTVLQRLALGTPLRRMLYDFWERIPYNTRRVIKPFLRIIGR